MDRLEAFLQDHDQWKDKTADELDMTKYTIMLHVSLGLQKLHDMNVLHRDIKSNNILLDGAPGTCPTCDHSGNWKICDFGEAKVLEPRTVGGVTVRGFVMEGTRSNKLTNMFTVSIVKSVKRKWVNFHRIKCTI